MFEHLEDSFHELSLMFWGGPIAVILVRKNHLRVRKVEKMKDFFINKFGIFESDTETEYRYGKQPISFYNSHETHIPQKVVKNITKYYRKRQFGKLRKELEKVYPELRGQKFENVFDMFRFVVDNTQHRAIDIDTEKFLPLFRAYNPLSIKALNEACHIGKKGIESLHPTLKQAMPITVAIIVGIVMLALIQNGPKYAREASSYFDNLLGGGFIFQLSTLITG